ncbi:MAG: hypothetical protein ACQEU4_05390 [Bacillota bacterium]
MSIFRNRARLLKNASFSCIGQKFEDQYRVDKYELKVVEELVAEWTISRD